MKKILPVFLLLVILLTAGCDLRNRRPSSDFIPPTHETDPRPTVSPTEASITPIETSERKLTRHSVHSVSNTHDIYTDIYGKEWSYEFKLPFVDYPTMDASNCNREIENHFLRIIKEQQKLASELQPLSYSKIDYLCYTTGDLITVNVWAESTEGETDRAVYCFRDDGSFATPTEILDALWIDEDAFYEALVEKLTATYEAHNIGMEEEAGYQTNLDNTLKQAEDLNNLQMYASEDDRLYVLVNVYDTHRVATNMELEIRP